MELSEGNPGTGHYHEPVSPPLGGIFFIMELHHG